MRETVPEELIPDEYKVMPGRDVPFDMLPDEFKTTEVTKPWAAKYPHLAAVPETIKEFPSELKRLFYGEPKISPKEGLYDIPKKTLLEKIPEFAVEHIPFREEIIGLKKIDTDTLMEGLSYYAAGKFLGEGGAAFKRTFPKIAEFFTKPWFQKPNIDRRVVVQTLGDMLKRAETRSQELANRGYSTKDIQIQLQQEGLTEKAILDRWDNPTWRKEALTRRMKGEEIPAEKPPIVEKPKVPEIAKPELAKPVIKGQEVPLEMVPKELMKPEVKVEGVKSVPEGMIRFYHGGIKGEGPRDVSPDYAYAKGYADKTPGAVVQYVDIPKGSPLLVKAFDDTGATVKAPYVSFTAPKEVMMKAETIPEAKVEGVKPPTAQHLELMPEEYPDIKSVAVKQDGKIYTDHVHGEIVDKYNLDPEKAIPGFVTKEGKFVEQYPERKLKGLGEAGFIRIGKEPGLKFEGDASKVEGMFEKAEKTSKEIHKTDLARVYQQIKRATVDVSGNLKKTLLTMREKQRGKLNPAEEVVMRHELIAGANPKASYLYNEAFKGIFRDLSELEQTYLDRVIQARRTIEIESYKPEVKHPEELGTKELQEWLDQIPKELKIKLDVRADLYFKEMRTQGIDQLLTEKIITQKQYDALSEHIYSPRQFLQHIDPERTFTIAGKKITVPDSGIKALEEGSYGLLESDSRLLLSQVITRTQTRIFRNRASKSLYDLAKEIPDNGVVRLAKVVKTTEAGKLVYEPTPTGFDKIKVMINGTPREMLMPSEMAMEWITRDPLLTETTASVIRWMSGSAILKPMATGLNPEFALTNVPRDIIHIWLTDYRATYSKTLPIFLGQMGKDLKTVTKDALTRKGRTVDYIKDGGGMEFLTHQGWFKKEGLSQQSQDLQKVLGYLGETSEIMTRLALRERAIKEGYTPEQATWLARNYLDFSQGGNFIKAVDTGVPYLNAAFQATRGVFRAAALNPALFTWKMAQLGAIVIGLFYLNRFTDPEAWENISSKEKAANFILPTPFRFKDKEGNKRMVYFRIPKDQTIRPIMSAFEALAAKVIGDKVDTDEIVHAVQEFSPIGPTQVLPPTFEAFLGYVSNKDFWRNEDIWKGPKIKPGEEYTKYTHPLFIKAGKLTGLSPERLRYALEQYFTYGNIYSSVGSYAWKLILDELPEAERQMVAEELILKQPFIRRLARTTRPAYALIKETEKTKIEANTERYKLTRKFDSLSQKFYDKEITKTEIDSFLKELPIEEKVRLKTRHFRMGRIQELPEKRWWLELAETPPEARALIYWNRWRIATEEEKTILEKNRLRVPGIMGGSFIKRLNELKGKE